ncbi:tetratricopeptide repeat protein [Saccharothrix lopnurensis]|uniref:non-specific serine/threonine protein kinase n=1 Tax=Saccharothrix lopnurensis TaxID=1670621 RepID=A0ABW1P9A0_9PSEU
MPPAGAGAARRPDVADDPFPLPDFAFPDPESLVLPDPRVPEGVRRCANEACPDRTRLPPKDVGHCLSCGTPFSFRPSLAPGDVVEQRYEVCGPIAHGGLGWVYLARDSRLNDRYCVLKGLIDASHAALTAFEVWALTQMDHPNIVGIYNFVKHPDERTGKVREYIVMEYVPGLPLNVVATAAQQGNSRFDEPLLTEHVITCGLQVLAALGHLHERDMLYCDLKPDNVMIRPADRSDPDTRIKLIDLGGARQAGDTSRPIVITRRYQVSAEEISARGMTVASEIHTVGETLNQLYRATSDHTGQEVPAERHGREQQRIAVGIESFKLVCARARHPEPERRFAGAAEMARQLRGVRREIASLRDGVPRPEPSALFADNAVLLDAGLGAVPPLTRWTRRAADVPLGALPLDIGTPTPIAVATGLPMPRPRPDDPAADVPAPPATEDAPRLLAQLKATGLDTAEVAFARVRAGLAAGEPDAAAAGLARARELQGDRDWRLRWHEGLVELAAADTAAARSHFEEVRRALPGEIAPELALACCAELLGTPEPAEPYYLAVWRRDRSVVSAVFGLARVHLARGDRAGAVALLDETPDVSRHHDAARIAAVRVLSGTLPGDDHPTGPDLDDAAARLGALYLDGGEPAGESRTRLETVVHEARFGLLPAPEAAGRAGDDLRALLERAYRALARQTADRGHRSDLVDLANEHRPFTFR